MKVQDSGFLSLRQVQDQYLSGTGQLKKGQESNGVSFQDILNNKQEETQTVRFSKHAASRLADRQIELSRGQLDRLQEGTEKAQQKGIKESLVLVDQLAFIVNVPSSTVVTAMDRQDATENIFTNIDGAVII